jgi:hypothetical protein
LGALKREPGKQFPTHARIDASAASRAVIKLAGLDVVESFFPSFTETPIKKEQLPLKGSKVCALSVDAITAD